MARAGSGDTPEPSESTEVAAASEAESRTGDAAAGVVRYGMMSLRCAAGCLAHGPRSLLRVRDRGEQDDSH